MKNRSCYCGSLSKETLELQNIPSGYCGICEICNQPGHTQPFPGSTPYTGAWCDVCYQKLELDQRRTKKVYALFYAVILLLIICIAVYQLKMLFFK